MTELNPGITIRLKADQPDGASTFVEIEDDNGHSINIGQITTGPDTTWSIRITATDIAALRPAAEPNACQHCNIPHREHYQRWNSKPGWHGHVQPTDEQRLARMRARRAASTPPAVVDVELPGGGQ